MFGYREVWAVDFEFGTDTNGLPYPRCLVAHELIGGNRIDLWLDGCTPSSPPYPTGPDVLFVAYMAAAEIGCHLALDWPVPERVLDLYVEFKNRTNGTDVEFPGLLDALIYYGLDAIGAGEKEAGRELAMRPVGYQYTEKEKQDLIAYCATDVIALARLLPAMHSRIDLSTALIRGRYMSAVARMERNGIPIDMETMRKLRAQGDSIEDALIAEVDKDYGFYNGREFSYSRFEAWVINEQIPWPTLESGKLSLDKAVLRELAKAYPKVAPFRELRTSLGKLRLTDFLIGEDGRSRCSLKPFWTKTSRNQPTPNEYIFGDACWVRALIQPPEGFAVAYIDWSQQEFGIAGALSGDTNMQRDYHSGDPYLAFGKTAGGIPVYGTKETHGQQRELYKQCALGVQYGKGPDAIAKGIGQPPFVGRNLLRQHKAAYRQFWYWSDAVVRQATLTKSLETVFGWQQHVTPGFNPRSIANFPMQANGAEMMRLAACLATEADIEVCAPVHDAFLIMAPKDEITDAVASMQACMAEASRVVLDGFELRSDAEVVGYPDRYMDGRGLEDVGNRHQAVALNVPPWVRNGCLLSLACYRNSHAG